MTATVDNALEYLRGIYGSTLGIGDLMGQYYEEMLGSRHPSQAAVRALFDAESGQSINDAMAIHFATLVGTDPTAFDFTGLSNSDSLPAPWVDCHLLGPLPNHAWTYADEHDKLGIRSGAVARVETGVDDLSQGVPGSGSRGTAHIHTPYADDVSVQVVWNGDPDVSGTPAIHFNPGNGDLAIAGPFRNPAFNSWEFFLVGAESGEFQYCDMFFDTTYVADVDYTLELRSKDGQVAGFLDGDLIVGPMTIPPALLGTRSHGLHIDSDNAFVNLPSIKEWSVTENGLALPVRSTPAILDSTTAEVTSSNTLSCTYPANIQAGETIIIIVGSTIQGGLASTGFTHSASDRTSVAGVSQLGVLRKVAVGTESGAFNVTKGGTVGHMAGIVLRCGPSNLSIPFAVNLLANGSASTSLTAPSGLLLGPHRRGLWAGTVPSNTAITPPTGWTQVAATGVGGSAINLVVAQRDWHSEHSPPFSFSGLSTPTQVGTIGASSASVGGHLVINPAPAS